jgi:hypothetical protein
MFTAFLVPAGRDRYELYSEAPDDPVVAPEAGAGRIRRALHAANLKWHELVDRAQQGRPKGRVARWRDAAICQIVESIAEQRTLWALRHHDQAALEYPATIDESRAREILRRILAHGRLHHGRWLAVDLILFIASGILFFVPGPNIVAYYLAFRVVGHFNSWRGARQAIDHTTWSCRANAGLGELAALVHEPRDTRAPRVAAIAARLNLPRLSAFFDRVAA